jgi:hypothetical protein
MSLLQALVRTVSQCRAARDRFGRRPKVEQLLDRCLLTSWGGTIMTRTSRQAAAFRPSVEFLECRCVPATISPTTFADGGLGSGSLRCAQLVLKGVDRASSPGEVHLCFVRFRRGRR